MSGGILLLGAYVFGWLVTFGLGMFLVWQSIPYVKGLKGATLKGSEALSEAEQGRYARTMGLLLLCAGVWCVGLSLAVVAFKMDKTGWLVALSVAPLILTVGFQWARRKHGISEK